MHGAICKGMLKVGFWEAQKGLKGRRKKLHSATGEAQFREDFRLHLNKGLWSKQFRGCLRNFSKFTPLTTRDIRWGSVRGTPLMVHLRASCKREAAALCTAPAAAGRRKREAQKGGAKARRRALWLFSTLRTVRSRLRYHLGPRAAGGGRAIQVLRCASGPAEAHDSPRPGLARRNER